MKKKIFLFSMLFVLIFLLFGCNKISEVGDLQIPLSAPTGLKVENDTFKWNPVEYASGYMIKIDEEEKNVDTTSFSLLSLPDGDHTLYVKALGDGLRFLSSDYSNSISYLRKSDTGKQYSDQVTGAFGSFDEINTKNSFLGYGIDVINASAISSKNVLMTYPIFNMDMLMDEQLLKSNEHYNRYEAVSAKTIEEFTDALSNSSSVSSGMNVSLATKASAGIGDISASAERGLNFSFSKGLKTCFTKTSSSTTEQAFVEIMAENQSYWLILQSSEARYKELLSEEFKSDLYNSTISPANLFTKYGTHLLTSVAMGGSICMYYTLYTTDTSVKTSDMTEVSSQIKAEVKSSYGVGFAGIASAEVNNSVGYEHSDEKVFQYSTMAKEKNIEIDTIVFTSGGGSYGINSEETLVNNYDEWQKSLDTYPVVIGIKDTNSLYPIWKLLDLSVEGAEERYRELYEYFVAYGSDSYNELCEMYQIVPPIAPTNITDIQVGEQTDCKENQEIYVKAGDTHQISFTVLPENANKYDKLFSVSNTNIASIDENGRLTVSNDANGVYFTVTITAGSITKRLTFYVVNTYNVTFNTRIAGLTIPPLIGVLDGYLIDEPQIEREGYILEGWFTDDTFTTQFNFEEDGIHASCTLYAKWTAIKPIITFNTDGGSEIENSVIAYKTAVSKPKNPVKTGYTFDNWYTDEELTEVYDFTTLLKENLTLYAGWNIIKYTVSFDSNGGIPGDIASQTTDITKNYRIVEPTVTRMYYTFDGWWYSTDEGRQQKFFFEEDGVTKDMTLQAKWTVIPITVKFRDGESDRLLKDEHGFDIADKTTSYEESFLLENFLPPVKEGYSFNGWYYNGRILENINDVSRYNPNEGIKNEYILYATWTINTYTLTYKINGETVGIVDYKYQDDVTLKTAENRTGYTFSGWTNEKSGAVIPSDYTMPAQDTILVGTYTISRHRVKYEINGEIKYTDSLQDYGSEISYKTIEQVLNATELNNLSANGTIPFDGWMYQSSHDLPATMLDHDIIITGTFGANAHHVYYVVTGDEAFNKEIIGYAGNGIPGYEPEKEGYSFNGWTYNNGEDLPTVMPDQDITLTGYFTKKEYEITLKKNGGNSDTMISVPYKSVLPTFTDTTKTGYTITGYYTAQENGTKIIDANHELIANVNGFTDESGKWIKTGDVLLYAQWSANTYTVIYNGNKPSNATGSVTNSASNATWTYDSGATLANAPSLTGWTFSGWYKESGCTNKVGDAGATLPKPNLATSGTVTLYAKWTQKTYMVTYNGNKPTKASGSVANLPGNATWPYDANATLSATAPTLTGWTFGGWYKESGCTNKIGNAGASLTKPNLTTSSSVTIYAKWTANTYSVTCNLDGGTIGNGIPTAMIYDEVYELFAPTKTGYIFNGWKVTSGLNPNTAKWGTTNNPSTKIVSSTNCKNGDNGIIYVKNINPTNNDSVTLTATWTAREYTVTFNANSGVLPFSVGLSGTGGSVTFNTTSLLSVPTEGSEYYDIAGWYTASSGGVKVAEANGSLCASAGSYTDSSKKWVYAQDVTLYAQWKTANSSVIYIGQSEKKATVSGTTYYYSKPLSAITSTGNYLLIQDITLNNTWTAISTFSGVLEGNNHTISGILFSGTLSTTGYYGGLFNTLNNATVKNLCLLNVNIVWTNGNPDIFIGGLAGQAINSIITNVSVTGKVRLEGSGGGGSYAGGLVGAAESSTFTGCTNNATVYAYKGWACAGGIAGKAKGVDSSRSKFINCTNNGSIYAELMVFRGTAKAGGILGWRENSYVDFENCTNTGSRTAAGQAGATYLSGEIYND